ncbi:hypothetical protein [Xanthomonas sacchari]|uniref:hypothetical protein n=1 Tax=Xanthomonas sacchari TaxID=56458 RepID=UPI00224DBD36|nr:hypothetical protein [Xanthomonas sacchari]
MTADFQEIGHSGGRVTIQFGTNPETGARGYQLRWSHSRPVPASIIELYALPQGIPLETVAAFGIGETIPPPSVPGAWLVMLCSDSTGQFGHHCPRCSNYWRSGPFPAFCPYCRLAAEPLAFLSGAQRAFIRQYCAVMAEGFKSGADGVFEIDMDAVADAVGVDTPKPAFYVSEQSQQHKFNCAECDEFNDVIGRYVYCSKCGTRNDLDVLRKETIPAIRDSLNAGGRPEDAIRNLVSAFDSFVAQYAKQLSALVPLTKVRQDKLVRKFHDFNDVVATFSGIFDIDLRSGIKPADAQFIALEFHRRHVFEHNGGEVDEAYLRKSGDASVKLRQLIREDAGNAHRLLDLLAKVAANLHSGFHSLIPVRHEPIDWARKHGIAKAAVRR